MVYDVIGTILAIILCVAAVTYAESGYGVRHFLSAIFAVVFGFAAACGVILLCVCGWSWQASQVQADLLNREYGTNYTREEVFYASEMIDVIRELDRNRYEVNGDIRRERDPQRDKYQQKK